MYKNLKTIFSLGAFAFFIFIAFGSSDDKKSETYPITTETKKETDRKQTKTPFNLQYL
jgi:hypothetical protein